MRLSFSHNRAGPLAALFARLLSAVLLSVTIAGPAGMGLAPQAMADAEQGRASPEAATGIEAKSDATAKSHMVSAANPYAVEAGREILRAGGSAVDAAIATQLVLNLVEPQSSGIGGGAFILHFEKMRQRVVAFDGRETAPAAATPDRFMRDGRPLPFRKAVNSGLSIGVPGLVRVMEDAHRKHGRLDWAALFQPAIKLAREGFTVSTRLHLLLRWMGADWFTPPARDYFFPDGGAPVGIGDVLKNPEFADTLEKIAAGGSQAFYTGGLAEKILDAAKAAPNFASDLTMADLAGYRSVEREPVCVLYRAKRVCGMGPPSSGAHTVGQTLAMLEGFAIGDASEGEGEGEGEGLGVMGPRALHLIAEAQKLAYADRDRYIADPAFVDIPRGLLDPNYIAQRRGLIDPDAAMSQAPEAGTPPGLADAAWADDATIERSGTSHISVVDRWGNAVSMTTTIEGAFGSGVWAAGFLLNNELTDFSFRPVDGEGRDIANRVEAGKRPRSSMAPTLVFDKHGDLEAVLGSPGGSRIIVYVTKALIALIDWEMSAQEAASLINFGSRRLDFEIELSDEAIWHGLKVKALGHRVRPDLMTSGLHIIVVRDGFLEGGADPRREGVAQGD